MALGGRPVERPAHLLPEQRQQAQQRTRQWRGQCERSQRAMAAEIGVSYSAYRPWENGRDQYAGPTRLQTDQLNKALRRLLGDRYTDGEAFDVWGWPREQDLSYDHVVELLRSAGFDVPRLPVKGRPPARVFWVHRVREPNLVHGVFSLAAAAATRAGLPVHLLLDDVALPERERYRCEEFEFRVRTWVAFASGDDAKLSTNLYSAVLTSDYLAERGWSAINDYLNGQSRVLDFLVASKVISPLHFRTHAEESVLALLRDSESRSADRLLTPLRNWLVFEREIARILRLSSVGDSDTIITLGGEDERVLWDVWHRGCSDDLSTRVQHIYLRSMPMPSYLAPWQVPALTTRTDRPTLTMYLNHRTDLDGHSDLAEWLLRSAIRLPASLNPGFHDGLDPALGDVDALLRASSSELSKAVGAVAKAVVEWFTL
jgi:transcriptional regulator with XRE-family HTH domain